MSRCDVCGTQESMPYHCRHCGGTHCAEHRLPEAHDCPGLENWGDPDGVFDSGFEATVENDGSSSGGGLTDRLASPIDARTGGPLAYVRGNVAYTFLGIIWVVFFLEMIVVFALQDPRLFSALFVLSTGQLEYVWTWITSVFSHDPTGLFHIAGNSIVLYFFGPVLERRIGSRKFAGLFLVTGVVAGLSQILVGLVINNPSAGVLGASGAIMGVLGALTILNPDLRVYLYFILPIPLWVLTFGYAGLSLFGMFSTANVTGNIAHAAHLSGLLLGLFYGYRLKQRGISGPGELRFGSRRGPGGPGGPGGRGPF